MKRTCATLQTSLQKRNCSSFSLKTECYSIVIKGTLLQNILNKKTTIRCQLLCTQETQQFVYAGDRNSTDPLIGSDQLIIAHLITVNPRLDNTAKTTVNSRLVLLENPRKNRAHCSLSLESVKAYSVAPWNVFKHCKSLCMSKKTRSILVLTF